MTFLYIILVILFWKIHFKHGFIGLIPNLLGTLFVCLAIRGFFTSFTTHYGPSLGENIRFLIIAGICYSIPVFIIKIRDFAS